MRESRTFTETIDGRRAWIHVDEARGQASAGRNAGYIAALGFGVVPSLIEMSDVLQGESGIVRTFHSIHSAQEAAREELVRRHRAGGLVRRAPAELRLRRPSGHHARTVRLGID